MNLNILVGARGFGQCVSDGKTSVVFVEPGEKVNCDHVLIQGFASGYSSEM